MNDRKREVIAYFENMCLFVLGALLVVFPLLFLSTTTDAFVLPKQIALIVAVTIFAILFCIKTVADGKLKFRTSPFDLAVFLFLLVAFASAILSINRYDAFITFVPLFFSGLLYYCIVNSVRSEKQLLFLISSLVTGAGIAAILSVLSFLKVYIIPLPYTHFPFFTTFGSLLDQALYFGLVLPIAGYFIYPLISGAFTRTHASPFQNEQKHNRKKTIGGGTLAFTLAFLLIAAAFGISVYLLLTTQKPLILPFEVGLQTGFAAISQDAGNMLKSFALGSGTGTYLIDFTRFKPALYNSNPDLWSFTFFRSSSYILEILATMGVLGLLSFIYLIFRIIKEKNFFPPLLLALIAACFLPFSFTLVSLLFILLAIFAVVRVHANPEKYNDVDYYLVTLKKGLLMAVPDGQKVSPAEKKYSKILPITFLLVALTVVGVPLYFALTFFVSDLTFQKSLVAASQNNGLQTYQLQTAAIKEFPYRDLYYRGFSQTNVALANSLAVSQQNGASPSAQTQQNIVTLIQQGINAGRTATSVSPMTSFNWNNLSSIYRSLIGFGQNADQFTILTLQQAIALDPNNPQQYVDLGGVYYQLGAYDDAMRQFQIAVNLKRDYANAYYNLGHALEAKGDTQNALAVYQTVLTLVQKDQENSKKMSAEIETLKTKLGSKAAISASPSAQVEPSASEEQAALDVNKPSKTLPERNPQVKIPEPTISKLPSSTPSPKVSPTE